MAYIYINTDIEVEVEEYFDSMNEKEKKKMFQLLSQEFMDHSFETDLEPKPLSIIEQDIKNSCKLISKKYYVLDKSDLETIVKISQKLK